MDVTVVSAAAGTVVKATNSVQLIVFQQESIELYLPHDCVRYGTYLYSLCIMLNWTVLTKLLANLCM